MALEHGIQTLISIREAVVKEKLKGKAPNILSDVVQNNLDSALDITRIQLDSDPSVLSQLKVKFSFFEILKILFRQQTAFIKFKQTISLFAGSNLIVVFLFLITSKTISSR